MEGLVVKHNILTDPKEASDGQELKDIYAENSSFDHIATDTLDKFVEWFLDLMDIKLHLGSLPNDTMQKYAKYAALFSAYAGTFMNSPSPKRGKCSCGGDTFEIITQEYDPLEFKFKIHFVNVSKVTRPNISSIDFCITLQSPELLDNRPYSGWQYIDEIPTTLTIKSNIMVKETEYTTVKFVNVDKRLFDVLIAKCDNK